MAKVYSMDLRLENYAPAYVRAESKEQAIKFFLDFLQTDEGKEYVRRKIARAVLADTFRTTVSMIAYETSDQWPLDMFDIDATESKAEEIAS